MTLYPRLLLIAITLFLFSSCGQTGLGEAELSDNWEIELSEWKQNRVERLKEPSGWLRLAGMFTIEEGEQRFGSGDDQDIRFPEGSIPEHAGVIVREGGLVTMVMAEGVEVESDGEMVSEIILYDGDETPRVTYGSLEWFVIVRHELLAIRLYNNENEKADAFEGFPSFVADRAWVREARFSPNPEGSTIEVVNVLGQVDDVVSPGSLQFTIEGETYLLDALVGGERLFIIFGDLTNRTDTYQAGRFLYVDYPEEGSDRTVIDFNRAYNPPCAFNPYTTCQLPPPQNRLNVAVTAGEKRPVGWSGVEI